MQNSTTQEINDAKETLEIFYEIGNILNCDLDRQTISIIVTMIENGCDPFALASIVKEIKNEHLSNS